MIPGLYINPWPFGATATCIGGRHYFPRERHSAPDVSRRYWQRMHELDGLPARRPFVEPKKTRPHAKRFFAAPKAHSRSNYKRHHKLK